MPSVKITLSPCDEETKRRIEREVGDALAESLAVGIGEVSVSFDEVPAGEGSAPGGAPRRAAYSTIATFRTPHIAEYLRFREEVVNPALAAQPGFVSTQLIRTERASGEYLNIHRWLSKSDADSWQFGQTVRAAKQRATGIMPRPHEELGVAGGTIIHQRFGIHAKRWPER